MSQINVLQIVSSLNAGQKAASPISYDLYRLKPQNKYGLIGHLLSVNNIVSNEYNPSIQTVLTFGHKIKKNDSVMLCYVKKQL